MPLTLISIHYFLFYYRSYIVLCPCARGISAFSIYSVETDRQADRYPAMSQIFEIPILYFVIRQI